MKTYKHPILGRTAEDSNNENVSHWERSYTVKMPWWDNVLAYWFSFEELLATGFEEVVQEEQKGVPQWFVNFIKEGSKPMEGFLGKLSRKYYTVFLKHHPKQEELSVEEIMKKLEEVYYFHKEAKIWCDWSLLDDFEKVLRTYAIQDTSQSLLPLDIEKVAQRLEWNTCTHIHHSMHKSVWIAIRQILSEYWTPKITE